MCGHKRARRSMSTGDAYEGQTTRLSSECRWNGAYRSFPWWTLWLIWPLIGLFKAMSVSIFAGWAALGTLLIPANILIGVALLVVGVALILRQMR